MFNVGDILIFNPKYDGHNPWGTASNGLKVKVLNVYPNQVYIEVIETNKNYPDMKGNVFTDPSNMYILDIKMTPSLKLFLEEETC